MWPEGTQRPTYAQAARRDEAKDDVTTVLAAFKREFQQDMMKEMQAFADKMMSAQAAATPVAAAAKDIGQAGEQALRAEVNALKQKVDDLTKSKDFGQGLYHSTYSLLQEANREIEKQKVRILELEQRNPFVTPVKLGTVTMPGIVGGAVLCWCWCWWWWQQAATKQQAAIEATDKGAGARAVTSWVQCVHIHPLCSAGAGGTGGTGGCQRGGATVSRGHWHPGGSG